MSKKNAASVRVSVIIVNYNSGVLLTECVRSVLQSTVSVEVLVADNGSTDDSLHLLQQSVCAPELRIINNGENLGFAKANNRVIPMTKGEYLLFLNPDCLLQADTLQRMLDTLLAYPNTGMAGCLIVNPDGSEQAGCRRRVPTPWRSLVRMLYLNRLLPWVPRFQAETMHHLPLPEEPVSLEAISGAFMLIQRQDLQTVGLMDDDYFLHCEDLDWCMRFRQHQRDILFVPDVQVMHVKGGCSHSRPIRVEWHKHCGMMRFYRKFFRHQYPFILMPLVMFGVWLHFSIVALCSGVTHFRH